ncbi:MAG: hypothetical protein HYR72_20680 [Deltaproteobacteria bacterium]|nr:hypothetical protein [Deltaproteobacteria bacterium]MBI3389329.1 hypothetical protein [Deltaproteobacteria bacterium]
MTSSPIQKCSATRQVRVIDLPTLIEIKSSAGRAKDRLVIPMLLALLREREHS